MSWYEDALTIADMYFKATYQWHEGFICGAVSMFVCMMLLMAGLIFVLKGAF